MAYRDVYQEVTDEIVKILEAGAVPWRQPILGGDQLEWPTNLISGKRYRGINVFLLALKAMQIGYRSKWWVTFRQARERGGHVKQGERGSLVVFWKQLQKKDEETGENKIIPVIRHYHVWNLDQTEGLGIQADTEALEREFTPIEEGERIVRDYVDGPTIEHSSNQAFYRPKTDTVHIPEPTRFRSDEEYYSTLFHELGHSTGASHRLNRGLDSNPKPFGSSDYSKEELIAELASAYLCGVSRISPITIEQAAAYCDGWLKVLKKDKRMIVQSAAAGQRAADWILGERVYER